MVGFTPEIGFINKIFLLILFNTLSVVHKCTWNLKIIDEVNIIWQDISHNYQLHRGQTIDHSLAPESQQTMSITQAKLNHVITQAKLNHINNTGKIKPC